MLPGKLEPRDDSAFPVDVMGEVRHQHALEAICGGRVQDGSVLVVPAQCLPDDQDASRVRVEIGGVTVGYLTSVPAWVYLMTMNGAASECRARIYGGSDHGKNSNAGYFGVRLDLALRDIDPEIAPHRGAYDYRCEIQGESKYQPVLRSIIERRTASKPASWVPLVIARLEPDASNPSRVHVVVDGQIVGYLGKVTARQYGASKSAPHEVPARITTWTSGGRTRYGVSLELSFDEAAVARVRAVARG
jgi:hypothetical protein